MRPASELLAGNAMSHNVFRVSHGGRPVKPCSNGFGNKCATARVVPTDALVDLEQQGFVVFFVDASLEDLGEFALIQLPVDYCECFGPSTDVSGFCDVLW